MNVANLCQLKLFFARLGRAYVLELVMLQPFTTH
jgi:hypothetical protein